MLLKALVPVILSALKAMQDDFLVHPYEGDAVVAMAVRTQQATPDSPSALQGDESNWAAWGVALGLLSMILLSRVCS